MKALDIIKNLIKLAGSVAGIILVSIGSVMVFNSILKVYVFGLETGRSFDVNYIWRCERINPDSPEFQDGVAYRDEKVRAEGTSVTVDLDGLSQREITKQEKDELILKYNLCIEKEISNEKQKYKKEKIEFLADGVAFLLVGLIVLFFYRGRKEDK